MRLHLAFENIVVITNTWHNITIAEILLLPLSFCHYHQRHLFSIPFISLHSRHLLCECDLFIGHHSFLSHNWQSPCRSLPPPPPLASAVVSLPSVSKHFVCQVHGSCASVDHVLCSFSLPRPRRVFLANYASLSRATARTAIMLDFSQNSLPACLLHLPIPSSFLSYLLCTR